MTNMLDVENDVQALNDYIVLNNYEINYSCDKCVELANWLHNWLNEIDATDDMDKDQVQEHQAKLMNMLWEHLQRCHDVLDDGVFCNYWTDKTLQGLIARIFEDYREARLHW